MYITYIFAQKSKPICFRRCVSYTYWIENHGKFDKTWRPSHQQFDTCGRQCSYSIWFEEKCPNELILFFNPLIKMNMLLCTIWINVCNHTIVDNGKHKAQKRRFACYWTHKLPRLSCLKIICIFQVANCFFVLVKYSLHVPMSSLKIS
jgi:hypothetical protein